MMYIYNRDFFISQIKDKPEFYIVDKGDYTLINYCITYSDTFETDFYKECRGIVFSNYPSFDCIRRPLHKFFNLNEKPETQFNLLKNKKIVSVSEKLDGSMIAPFFIPNTKRIRWATNGDSEDFHVYIESLFLPENIEKQSERYGIDLKEFLNIVTFWLDANKTPIFEFNDIMLPASQIVVRYEKPFLKLLAVRDNLTGEYLDSALYKLWKEYRGDAILVRDEIQFDDLCDVVDTARKLNGKEGFVVQFENNELIKIKSPWYVSRHRLIDSFLDEYRIHLMVLNLSELKYDDIVGNLNDEQKDIYHRIENEIKHDIIVLSKFAKKAFQFKTKKEIGMSEYGKSYFSAILFYTLEGDIKDVCLNFIKQKMLNRQKFLQYKEQITILKGESDVK